MDFIEIVSKFNPKANVIEIYPSFMIRPSKDLLIKGGKFYAVWDDENQIWSTDIYRLVDLIDRDLLEYSRAFSTTGRETSVKLVQYFDNGIYEKLIRYLGGLEDSKPTLDDELTFLHDEPFREDYRSKRLPYDICQGDYSAWEELVGTLYTPVEKKKIEWAIGSIFTGDSKYIQKFIVLYGEAGTGKSTILRIIEQLFKGYTKSFEARELGRSNNSFSAAAFSSNPLVAIQHDGDLSRIEDNTKLNSIIAHEPIIINEKYKNQYTMTINSFLFVGTNQPVKITDSRSGIIRRLIDVHPTGRKVPPTRYFALMNAINFQLGAIAYHCKEVYESLGKNYYDAYRPLDMMYRTDTFFNFVEEHYFDFKSSDYCTLKQAWVMYKDYCLDSKITYTLPMNAFREELKSYFKEFLNMTRIDGKMTRSVYRGFLAEKFDRAFNEQDFNPDDHVNIRLVLDKTESIFDKVCKNCKAQYATENETPEKKWSEVDTKLSDIYTNKLHYVQLPENHIVIDFDLKNEKGEKDADRNLEAAGRWPSTYAEFSKGGSGVHLHYIYDGDATQLSRLYETGVEIKVFTGNSSLRRKLTFCNDKPIAHISSGLPLKEVKSVVDFDAILNEKAIRNLIERNLKKEIHPGTKPSIDFIYTILKEQYEKGAHYDVRDLRQKVLTFAMHSSHHAAYCARLVNKMKFCSDDISEAVASPEEDPIVFFDVEVYPNLFVVCWKYAGEGQQVVQMINPSPQDMEKLMNMKLVGFNNRRYDNHIIYARYLGYSNEDLFNYSQKIINAPKASDVFMREAFNISYTDVYDFAAAGNKMSLKKWEIELDIHHQEMSIPWDQPVPEDMWQLVADYCSNDVMATEAVYNHLEGDYKARRMLSAVAKSNANNTTNQLSLSFVFDGNKNPGLVYTDLATGKQYGPGEAGPYTGKDERGNNPRTDISPYVSKNNMINAFPGYEYVDGKNMFRGEDVGRGGYVYAQPGIYYNVVCFDVSGMHPASIRAMECFGEYTERFGEIVDARLAIKHKDYERAKTMIGGSLKEFLDNPQDAKDISGALKTTVNSLYGLTSAKFPNPAKDERNVNNIVALRGALFMVTLRDALIEKGQIVIHIKTDSIKVVNPSADIFNFIMDFGKKYGYTFEVEHSFERICLVNHAVYIAHLANDDPEAPGQWTATGAQFAQPYVFKSLFSKEPIIFKDYTETKSVSGDAALYLDKNESLPEGEHDYQFVGRVGSFVPVVEGANGGLLLRYSKDKYSQATGTTGYRWLEAEYVKSMHLEDKIDISYHRHLVDEALEAISQFGDSDEFINGTIYPTVGQS